VHVSTEFEGVSLIKQRTDLNTSLLQYSTALPRPKLKISGATNNQILAVRKVPWGTVVQLQSSAAHTPQILSELQLFDALKRIGIRNLVKKEVVKSPEAAYFAFPLAGQPPVVRYEIQNAWVDPMRDQLPGANREWYAAQHWVSVSSPGASVGL